MRMSRARSGQGAGMVSYRRRWWCASRWGNAREALELDSRVLHRASATRALRMLTAGGKACRARRNRSRPMSYVSRAVDSEGERARAERRPQEELLRLLLMRRGGGDGVWFVQYTSTSVIGGSRHERYGVVN